MIKKLNKPFTVLIAGVLVFALGVFVSVGTSKEVSEGVFESSALWIVPGSATIGYGFALIVEKELKKGKK
jgi:hypothetical protein